MGLSDWQPLWLLLRFLAGVARAVCGLVAGNCVLMCCRGRPSGEADKA
jgi:hypothetical protein